MYSMNDMVPVDGSKVQGPVASMFKIVMFKFPFLGIFIANVFYTVY